MKMAITKSANPPAINSPNLTLNFVCMCFHIYYYLKNDLIDGSVDFSNFSNSPS